MFFNLSRVKIWRQTIYAESCLLFGFDEPTQKYLLSYHSWVELLQIWPAAYNMQLLPDLSVNFINVLRV